MLTIFISNHVKPNDASPSSIFYMQWILQSLLRFDFYKDDIIY